MMASRQPGELHVRPASSGLAHGLAIVLFAAVVCLPCIRDGIPPGFDSEYHVAYQYHVSRQFWGGDLYPRWLASSNKGYGSPIFIAQYPLPYVATALLRPIVPASPASSREARELGIFFFLIAVGAGLSARAWFRARCAPKVATLAAMAYVLLPYLLGQALYRRAALGELCSFVWMPLALALCDSPAPRLAIASGIGGVLALLMLSNGLSAALFLPLLVVYAVTAWRSRGLAFTRCAGYLAVAGGLAAGIAAIYVVPLVAHRGAFELKRMAETLPALELGRYFVYATSSSLTSSRAISGGLGLPVIGGIACLTAAVGVRVWRAGGSLASRVAVTIILLLGLALLLPDLGPALVRLSDLRVSAFETPADSALTTLLTGLATFALGALAYTEASKEGDRRDQALLAVAAGAFFLMMPWSAPLWAAVPALSVFQFPFRFCGILTVAVAGLLAAGLDRGLRHLDGDGGRGRLAILVSAALLVIGTGILSWGVGGRFRRTATTDSAVAKNVDVMYRTYVPRQQLAAVAARLGSSLDSFDVMLTPMEEGLQVDFTEGHCSATVTREGPRRLHVWGQCGEQARLRMSQLWFPLWRLVPRGAPSRAAMVGSSADGLLEVRLPAGEHDFDLRFDLGWPERAGALMTLASLVLALGAWALGGGSTGANDGGPAPGKRS